MLKEILYFVIILLILAVVQHQDLLSEPMTRFTTMQENGNYLHPFIWTAVIYGIVWTFRLIGRFILKLKNK